MVATLIGFLATMIFVSSHHWLGYLMVFLGPTFVVLVHELGHALAAWRFGMNVISISVGPLSFKTNPPRLAFGDELFGADVGGFVRYRERRYLTRPIHIAIAAAGPLINLATAILLYLLAYTLGDGPIQRVIAGFCFASLAAFVLSAWPHRSRSGQPNDGLEIWRDLRVVRPYRAKKPARSPWQAP